jgi:integrase
LVAGIHDWKTQTSPGWARKRVVQHHPALAYAEAPQFMPLLSAEAGTAAAMLGFLIFTACRTHEVVGARWSEIDRTSSTWRIPGERMKLDQDHVVPLSVLLWLYLPSPLRSVFHRFRRPFERPSQSLFHRLPSPLPSAVFHQRHPPQRWNAPLRWCCAGAQRISTQLEIAGRECGAADCREQDKGRKVRPVDTPTLSRTR